MTSSPIPTLVAVLGLDGTGWLVLSVFVLGAMGSMRPRRDCRHIGGPAERPGTGAVRSRLMLWVAQGFGVGRLPGGPGTYGSVGGLLWTAVLWKTGHLGLYLAGMVAGWGLSIWLCGEAERILGEQDPGSVVLDEWVAMPLCFLAPTLVSLASTGRLPAADSLFTPTTWGWTLGVFAAFRLFDILKPWPIRSSQRLAAGWGITVDDLLAAVYVTLLWLAAFELGRRWGGA